MDADPDAVARKESELAEDASKRGAHERGRIASHAGVVAAGTLSSRLLGLVRDQVMAAVFSRGVTDAFFVAFTIPNVLRQVLAEGAMQSAVLPVLAATREREGDLAARSLFASLRGISLVVLTLVSVLGVLFAPSLVELFAAGFRGIPGQYERTVALTRWVFPYLFFMGTAALGAAALNTYQRFVVSAFAPLLLNVAFIVCSLALPAWLVARGEDPGLALALAVLVGGFLQVAAQWPSLRRIGFAGRPRLELSSPALVQVYRRLAPVLLGMGVYYLDVVLARRFLSELGLGAQSYFSWALRLCDFPQGIFVMALQTAALPSLSRLAAGGERAELERTFAYGMRLTLFVALPATALLVSLAEPIVAILFERGAFDRESTRETARALMAQGAGVWLVAVVRQLLSVYYALGNTRTPMLVAAVDLGVFVVSALLLRGPLGHVGVGAAVSIASAFQAGLLFYGLKQQLDDLRLKEIGGSFLKILAATLGATLAGALVGRLLGASSSLALVGLVSVPTFLVCFLLLARLFGSPELRALSTLLSRLRSRRPRS